ncbi:MAG: hypothetical protein JWO78_1534 [Micavibrio sp.]|nr:hypothetical protein [Micavibrio sp.]
MAVPGRINEDTVQRVTRIITNENGHGFQKHVLGRSNNDLGSRTASVSDGAIHDTPNIRFKPNEYALRVSQDLRSPHTEFYKTPTGYAGFNRRSGTIIQIDFSPQGNHGPYDSMSAYKASSAQRFDKLYQEQARMKMSHGEYGPKRESMKFADIQADIEKRLPAYEAGHKADMARKEARADSFLAAGAEDIKKYQQEKPVPQAVKEKPAAIAEEPHAQRRPVISLKAKAAGAGPVAAFALATSASAEEMHRPGSTPDSVVGTAIGTVIPGWMAARRGEFCSAFGEVAEVAAAGVASGVVAAPLVTGSVAATMVSGPAAPAVTATAIGTSAAVTPAAEAVCNVAASTFQQVKNKLTL